jgi:hypothetical protein
LQLIITDGNQKKSSLTLPDLIQIAPSGFLSLSQPIFETSNSLEAVLEEAIWI